LFGLLGIFFEASKDICFVHANGG